ncbi:aspartyl protease family protein [Flagellimonas myxillae]|uniref:aspartyl protease family protein n=1 Tax=Flagellimonas myxillae TaxID=2942214 RepID=UPI00201EEE24|nr:aspartyl protease family protein [Muricauda myxillae]MCL6268034.1 aspartyl protease family protein [Muricauda myxillae]
MLTPFLVSAQGFKLPKHQKFERVGFKMINNLIIIPVEINGAELTFVLDSGVSKPILFNLSDQDSIQINNVSEVTIRGLGDGEPMKALSSMGNTFKLGKAKNYNQDLYVVLDKEINFSTSLGIPVHGILGYDLFRDFVVEVNYGAETLKLHNPDLYKPSRGNRSQTLPITIERKKAYVEGTVLMEDEDDVPVKLLVDTGSSDALWLFHQPEKGLNIPEKNYEDYLGRGLSGDIFGKRAKVNGIKIGDFELKDAKAAFPYRESFGFIKNLGDRNGSVGGEILKRFNIVFDYRRGQVTLKKNGNFRAPFQYNMAGIALQHNGLRYIAESIADFRGVVQNDESNFGNVQILLENKTRLSLVPEIIVSGIRAGSPAAEAGLQAGDVILAVNGKRIHRYKLQEVLKMLNEREGKRVRVLIERYNRDLLFSFVLKKVFD